MKKSIQKNIIYDIKETEKILFQYKLIEDIRGVSCDDYSVKTINSPYFDKKYTNNALYWEKNIDNYTFKLVDKSIIYFRFDIKSNDIVKANINYISGIFLEKDYNEIIHTISDDEIEDVLDYERNDFEDFLIKRYLEKKRLSDNVIENILKLNRNITTIRLDIDIEAARENHPEIHLTLNNIKNSRFKVDKKYLVSDFICFILDIIYGIKINGRKGFISLKE